MFVDGDFGDGCDGDCEDEVDGEDTGQTIKNAEQEQSRARSQQ